MISPYIEAVDLALSTGRPMPFPDTRDDLQDLIDHYPERAKCVRPPLEECRRLGLVVDVKPMPPAWRERFLATLADDREFARAIGNLIGGAQ